MTSIGIPKSLFYYYYYPLWAYFFKFLGFKVISSPETNKKIVDQGIKHTVDEVCLPIKVFFGHVEELKSMVDYVFVPRIISVERKTFICPKFMGLPDMVIAANIIPEKKLLTPTINMRKGKEDFKKQFIYMGRKLGKSVGSVKKAWEVALEKQKLYEEFLQFGMLPEEALTQLEKQQQYENNNLKSESIAVLGHGYNVYDNYISMNIIQRISKRYRVVTPDMLSSDTIDRNVSHLPKKMFWSLGKKMLGGANYYLEDKNVRGIIYLASFGCGPDSLVGDLIERYVHRQKKKPFMLLTIDEHTGEAGIVTRLEAFLDMVERSGVM